MGTTTRRHQCGKRPFCRGKHNANTGLFCLFDMYRCKQLCTIYLITKFHMNTIDFGSLKSPTHNFTYNDAIVLNICIDYIVSVSSPRMEPVQGF